jgi:nitrile hydratase beta subunit
VDGIHDLGGMQGFGPVPRDEAVFHADWERRVFGMFTPLALAAGFPVDAFRHAIERMAPVEYLGTSYYEHWLHAFEVLVVERGLVGADELAAGHARRGEPVAEPALRPEAVPIVVAHGHSCRAEAGRGPRFQVGDDVVARNLHPTGHTRLPRYVRGRRGRVDQLRGSFVFPDTMAHGVGENPQHVYSVRFRASELWGGPPDRGDALYIDLFDDYLDPA